MKLKKFCFLLFVINLNIFYTKSAQLDDDQMSIDSNDADETSPDNIFTIIPYVKLAETIHRRDPGEINHIEERFGLKLNQDDLLVEFSAQIIPRKIEEVCHNPELPKYLPLKFLIKDEENLIQLGEIIKIPYKCSCGGEISIHIKFNFIDVSYYQSLSLEEMINNIEINNPKYYTEPDKEKILNKLANLLPKLFHNKKIKNLLNEDKFCIQSTTGLLPDLLNIIGEYLI